jgi:hypothetical protein
MYCSCNLEGTELGMDVEAVQPTPTNVQQYVRENLAGARNWLAQAHAMLAERPAIVAPPAHVQRALAAARNAAEHLYDVGQVDEPVEAVREALAAAEAIMVVVRRMEHPRPGFIDGRELAAAQLAEVDGTLAGLERELGMHGPLGDAAGA